MDGLIVDCRWVHGCMDGSVVRGIYEFQPLA